MTTAPDPGGAPGALSTLRANRNFRLLWIGQVLSDLGTQIGSLAYPLLVLALTHSAPVAVVDRIGETLFTPASIAALPLIVDDEHLEAAWAVSEGRQFAANIVGPPLGGLWPPR